MMAQPWLMLGRERGSEQRQGKIVREARSDSAVFV